MRIVLYPPIDLERLESLKTAAAGSVEFVNAKSPEEAEPASRTADAFLGKITPRILASAPNLRWVQAFTASLEHYMFWELVEHPCVLTNTRGLFGDVVAQQAMGYILCFARNLHTYIRRQIEHRYEPVGGESARVDNAMGPGVVNAMDRGVIDLSSSVLGVFGFGGIGQETAKAGLAFGLRAIAVDRFPERCGSPSEEIEVRGFDELPWLLTNSDFLVIAAPQTPETERLFSEALLEQMKRSAYLINVGRGAIVVLDDLAKALRLGKIAGAALDVFETEPLPADHPLWDMPNVIITPHTAGYSPLIARRHLGVLVENVRRFVGGEPLMNVVDKRLWF